MKDGKELAIALTDFVNSYNFDKEGFINQFCREHRTLQQSAVRLMLELLEHISTEEYRFDGRNQGSHKVCKDLMVGFKKIIIERELKLGTTEEAAINYANSEYCKPSKFLGHI